MSQKKFHFEFGVYGIISVSNKLLVIKKNGGPYNNRYDLPGGSLNEGEPLRHAIGRTVKEETSLEVLDARQLGTVSFRYPWNYQQSTWNEHVGVFYHIYEYSGIPQTDVKQYAGKDSSGPEWVDADNLNLENSSPLVLKAKEFVLLRKFIATDTKYDHWDVLNR